LYTYIILLNFMIPNIPNNKIIYGNNTKNHERFSYPCLHNHDNTNVHISAKNKFTIILAIALLLNNEIKAPKKAIAKYTCAGVHIFLNVSLNPFIYIIYILYIILKLFSFLVFQVFLVFLVFVRLDN
jgi:hypothetical protein